MICNNALKLTFKDTGWSASLRYSKESWIFTLLLKYGEIKDLNFTLNQDILRFYRNLLCVLIH